MAEVEEFGENLLSGDWTQEQGEAYERAVNLLVDLLGEVEPLSPEEERILEQAVSDSIYLRRDEACFDDVVEWLASSEGEREKGLGRLLTVVRAATGGAVEGERYGLAHVGSFSTPWVNVSPVDFLSWEIGELSEEDDTPVLRIGEEYAILLTPPVAAKMYRALGKVLREVVPEEVTKPKKSIGERWDGVLAWARSHKFLATVSLIVLGTVVVGLVYGFTAAGGSSIPG